MFKSVSYTHLDVYKRQKQPHAAKVSAIECWKMAGIAMTGMGVLFFLFPVGFMKIFTDDARVFPYAYLTMRIMA